jgi:hypothetical protein
VLLRWFGHLSGKNCHTRSGQTILVVKGIVQPSII